MSNCCGLKESDLNEDLEIIRINALDYVKEERQTVAIYREGNEFKYGPAEHAIEQGFQIVEVLSRYH